MLDKSMAQAQMRVWQQKKQSHILEALLRPLLQEMQLLLMLMIPATGGCSAPSTDMCTVKARDIHQAGQIGGVEGFLYTELTSV